MAQVALSSLLPEVSFWLWDRVWRWSCISKESIWAPAGGAAEASEARWIWIDALKFSHGWSPPQFYVIISSCHLTLKWNGSMYHCHYRFQQTEEENPWTQRRDNGNYWVWRTERKIEEEEQMCLQGVPKWNERIIRQNPYKLARRNKDLHKGNTWGNYKFWTWLPDDFKEELMPIILKFFPKSRGVNASQLIPWGQCCPDIRAKDTIRKLQETSILDEYWCQNPSKILANRIWQHIKRII